MKFKTTWQDKIFSGADDFYTERNLTRFFRELYPQKEWQVYRKVLKLTARDAEKAYQIGLQEGLAGHDMPTKDGLQALAAGSQHREEMDAILAFIYDAASAGHAVGKAKHQIMTEVKKNGSI